MLGAPLFAQSYVYIPSNTPTTGGCNVIPFGTTKTSATWVNQRYQTIITTTQLGNTSLRICSLAFAACTADRVRSFDELKITMAQIPATKTQLDNTFANNLTTRPTVVFDGKCHYWPVLGNNWSNIGLQRDFLYIPAQGNVVIEVIAQGNDQKPATASNGFRSYAGERNYKFTWTGPVPAVAQGRDAAAALKMRIGVQSPAVDNFGQGCGSGPLAINGTGTGKIGTPVAIGLSGGPTTGVGLIWLGFSSSAPYPIDLGPAGFTGCKLFCSIDVSGPTVFRSGNSVVPVTIPIPNDRSIVCGRLYSQGLAIESTAPGGITVSDMLRILIGL